MGEMTVDTDQGEDPSPGAGSGVRAVVAANVRRVRLARGLSLRDLSQSTGLSKALLSQVERAVANPTIEALARIAEALGLTFVELTREPLSAPEVIRGDQAAVQMIGESRSRALFTVLDRRRFEVSEGLMPPGETGARSDHGRGSVEHSYVVEGSVSLEAQGAYLELTAGDAVRFSSEAPHVYRAGPQGVRLITLITFSDD